MAIGLNSYFNYKQRMQAMIAKVKAEKTNRQIFKVILNFCQLKVGKLIFLLNL